MRKNKLLLCLSIIIIVFFGVITVYADLDGDYQGGGLDTSESGSGTTFYPYYYYDGKQLYFDGIRISFVKANGETIVSRNYMGDVQYYNNLNTEVRTITRACSHPSYSNGHCPFNWNLSDSIGDAARPISELQDMFKNVTLDNGDKYNFPVNVTATVASNSYTGIFDGLYRENNPSLSEEDYSNFIYKLFNNMLHNLGAATTVDDYVVKEEKNQLYDLFLVFEPITIVKMNRFNYMGTAYELAREARNQSAGGWKNSEGEYPCKGSSEGALCDLSSILKKLIPCKSYLNGSIIDSMKEKQSTILIQNFPDGYYFNNIKIDYNNSQKLCSSSSKYLSADSVSGNYGVGIGVLWLSDIYEGDENSCASIINGITWNWQGSFETAFNASGIKGIYDMFKEQVSSEYPYGYIAYNNGAGKADLKWFINQCTCYGMYDHYTKTFAQNYILNNQDKIIDISGSFGSNDWYMSTNLYEVNAEALDSIFNSAEFTQYNNENKLYAEQRGLPWDNATKDKYVDALKCGVKEKQWCEEFEDWYEETRKEYSKLRSYPTINQFKKNYTNQSYIDKVQTMIDAYNVQFYPLNGFNWTLEADDSGNNYSYIKHCINAETANCQTIIDFYKDNENKDLTKLSCETLENFDFTAFNNRYGTDITGQWFSANCGCSESTAYNCTPKYNLGTCTSGDDIIYTDSSNGVISDDYWNNCVFNDYGDYDINPHKVSDKTSSLTYYDDELSNKYCEIYCIEDLNASLVSPNIRVEAGTRFALGYSSVNGSRTCKTKTVDWDGFLDDLKEVTQEIVDNYAQMKAEEKANDVEWESRESCSTCCKSYERVPCDSDKDGVEDETCRGDCNNCGTLYIPEESRVCFDIRVTTDLGTFNGHKCVSLRSNCNGPTKYSASSNAYLSSIKKAQGYVEQMKSCSEWEDDEVYTVDPQATVIYSDDINYYYRDKLDSSTTYSIEDKSDCVGDKVNIITSCSGDSCTVTSIPVNNCSGDGHYAMMTRTAKTRFTLKPDVFRYVLKSNHLSIHPNELVNYDIPNFTTNYIDIGFPNFPVSFSAPEGVYGTNQERGQFDIEYSNLGSVKSGTTMVDTILSGSDIPDSVDERFGKWICEYTVYSDLLPEDGPDDDDNVGPGDIDLIYRPIDLHNPFPDINASGRDTGANWCDQSGDCSYDNLSVNAYIYNNRGVKYDEVYEQEPMYTFVLNPAIIKEIREYNDENSYSSYTGSLGTTQYFDYKCEEGTGRGCISEYLSYLIDITDAKNKPGTCVDDEFRDSSESSSFYGCRLIGTLLGSVSEIKN